MISGKFGVLWCRIGDRAGRRGAGTSVLNTSSLRLISIPLARLHGYLATIPATVCRAVVVLAFSAGFSAGSAAEAPRLDVPVDCALGRDCFIQNYVDIKPGPGASDYTCGPLANDGHKGTDFRVRDLTDVARGVAVLAAASGQVIQVRDGAPDGFPDEVARDGTDGRECGNGVLIDHGKGWSTQYCHLRQDSIRVVPGQRVGTGDPIGLVGMSGEATFPHVHLNLWYRGQAVDPFLGPGASAGCRSPAKPLWRESAARRLSYRPSGILNAGFTSLRPTGRGIERGDPLGEPPRKDGELWFYVRIFGLRAGDRERLRIFGPEDRLVLEHTTEPAQSDQTTWMLPVGRQVPSQGWPPGPYRGEFILIRGGGVVLETVEEIDIR